jgi:hypothetical protein
MYVHMPVLHVRTYAQYVRTYCGYLLTGIPKDILNFFGKGYLRAYINILNTIVHVRRSSKPKLTLATLSQKSRVYYVYFEQL